MRSFLNLKETFAGPVLAVKVLRKNIGYLSVSAHGEIDALAYFASDGRTDYFERFVREEFGGDRVVVQFNSSEGKQLIRKVKLKAKDTSYGLFSFPYYQKRLSEALAARIGGDLGQID